MRVGRRYKVKCPICGILFDSYEDYASHVFLKHPDSPWARFKGIVVEE